MAKAVEPQWGGLRALSSGRIIRGGARMVACCRTYAAPSALMMARQSSSSFGGRTVFEGDGGRQNLVGWFESDDESYRWLNDLVCIAEGLISATTREMVINVYAGIHEMRA